MYNNHIKIHYYRYNINNHKYAIEIIKDNSTIFCCKGIPNEIITNRALEYITNLVENNDYNIDDCRKIKKITDEIILENYDLTNIEDKLKNYQDHTFIENPFDLDGPIYDNCEMIIKCIELINKYDAQRVW